MHMLRTTLIASVLSLSLFGCNQNSSSSSDASGSPSAAAGTGEIVIKIGAPNPLTGPFANWGKDAGNGITLAVEEANASNIEWDGQKVRFEVMAEDDQADPKSATQVADRFVDAKVAGIIGHLTSGTAMPAATIYSENNIPMISGSVTSPSYTKSGYKNAFRIIANDVQQSEALAKFAVEKLGVKTFGIIHDKTSYGEGLAGDFANAATKLGAKKIGEEYTNTTATEFGAIVTAMKAKQPDLIFYGGMDPQGGPLVKELRRQGVTALFMGADGIKTSAFPELAKDAADGVYAATAGAASDTMPGYAAFDKKFQDRFQTKIQAYAPYTYDATNVMIEAMKKAKSADPDKYAPEIAKTNYEGVTGHIEFTPEGDIKNGTVTLYQYKDGKWNTVQ